MNKSLFIDICAKASNCIDNLRTIVDITKFQQSIDLFVANLNSYELYIPIMGSFNSGKSKAIHKLLNERLSDCNLTCELRYAQDEHIEAVKSDCSFDNFQSLDKFNNSKKYQYLRLYLNNEVLKEIAPLVLVDMIGFDDSTADDSIYTQYINKAAHFIILQAIDAKLLLSDSYIDLLDNIVKHKKAFSFCLSKVDLREEAFVNRLIELNKQKLIKHYAYQDELYLLGDEHCDNLFEILYKIDKDELIANIFKPQLIILLQDIAIQLKSIIDSYKYSKEDKKVYLEILNDSLINIEKQKRNTINNLERHFNTQNVEDILNAFRAKILENIDSITNAALDGNVDQEISNLINGFLLNEIVKSLEQIAKELLDSFKMQVESNVNTQGIESWADNLKSSINSLNYNTANILSTIDSKNFLNDDSTMHNMTSIASKLGSAFNKIGASTTVLNPLLGTVINGLLSVMPDIFKQFSDGRKKEHIKEQIVVDIIPKVMSNIRPQIASFIKEKINDIINNISFIFNEKIAKVKLEINEKAHSNALELDTINNNLNTLEQSYNKIHVLIKELS